MRTVTTLSIFLAAAGAASPAFADDDGLALSVRAAYGVPFGTAAEGTELNKLTMGTVPIQVDAGYRLNRNWEAGAYFSYGAAMIADEARTALEAQGATNVGGHRVMRAGVQGVFRFRTDQQFVPWAGLALGYEWTRYAAADVPQAGGGTAETEIGLGGLEATLQAGASYKLSSGLAVGPFAALSVGQFRSRLSWVEGAGDSDTKLADKGLHEWLQIGVRGTFDL